MPAAYDQAVLLKELYDLVRAVPDFVNITGTSIGGQQPDPTLESLTPPAVWLSFVGDQQKDPPANIVPTEETITFMFVAMVYLPNEKQTLLLSTHIPLLKKLIVGVRGQPSQNTGHRWAYAGQKLTLINTNRLVYAQRYTITGMM